MLMVLGLLAMQLWQNYWEHISTAETNSRNIAALIATQLTNTLARVDRDLQFVADQTPIDALARKHAPAYLARMERILDGQLVNQPEVIGYRIADASGDTLYTSMSGIHPRVNIADRSYFRLLRDNPDLRLEFSEVLLGRSSGQHVVVVARAIRAKNGDFTGIAYALLEVEHYQRVFQSLDLGAKGVVAIRRTDNHALVVRFPNLPQQINQPLKADQPAVGLITQGKMEFTLHTRAQSDGIERIYSVRALKNYPFYVAAGVTRESALATWRTRAAVIGASASLFLAIMLILLYRLFKSRRHEQQLLTTVLEAQERVEEVSRSKTRFLAAASHDLRQPVQAISLLQATLSGTPLNPDQRRIVDYLSQSTKRLSELVNVLLDISRFDSGAIKPASEPVSAKSVFDRIDASFSPLARAKQLALEFRLPAGDIQLLSDADLLDTLLSNLTGNAIKYTRRGRVLVSLRRRGPQALIQVWDTGTGIPAAQIDRIFEEYYQVGNPERDSEKGLGLGLAIAQRAAGLLGTVITCRSREGRGTVFAFKIPLV